MTISFVIQYFKAILTATIFMLFKYAECSLGHSLMVKIGQGVWYLLSRLKEIIQQI